MNSLTNWATISFRRRDILNYQHDNIFHDLLSQFYRLQGSKLCKYAVVFNKTERRTQATEQHTHTQISQQT
jgi:hypothetical protein